MQLVNFTGFTNVSVTLALKNNEYEHTQSQITNVRRIFDSKQSQNLTRCHFLKLSCGTIDLAPVIVTCQHPFLFVISFFQIY